MPNFFFKNLHWFSRYTVTYGTFFVTYGTVNDKSTKVSECFKIIQNNLEDHFPAEVFLQAGSLANKSFFMISFCFSVLQQQRP